MGNFGTCKHSSSEYSDGLQAGRPGFYFRQGQEFSLFHSVQTVCEAHSASCPMGNKAEFLVSKEDGA